MMTQGKQVRLSDGRFLCYGEYGDLQGTPEFYFPGFPGSRVEGLVMEEVARKLSVRIIAVDRPGIGLSTSKPGRTLLDWPDDLSELADALGLARFAVMGHSGGGAYAAACAYKIPHRLTAAGLVCSVGPVDIPQVATGALRAARLAYRLSLHTPGLLTFPYNMASLCVKRHAKNIIPLLHKIGARPDRLLLEQPRLRQMLIASHCEAVRKGHSGIYQDLRILTSPWGFSLKSIPIPINLWHGELDTVLPPVIGRHLARSIAQCRARFYSNEGHVSVPINRMEDILGTMAK
jgi:pimeloyl-ACP methyl ester carboxylesterase